MRRTPVPSEKSPASSSAKAVRLLLKPQGFEIVVGVSTGGGDDTLRDELLEDRGGFPDLLEELLLSFVEVFGILAVKSRTAQRQPPGVLAGLLF